MRRFSHWVRQLSFWLVRWRRTLSRVRVLFVCLLVFSLKWLCNVHNQSDPKFPSRLAPIPSRRPSNTIHDPPKVANMSITCPASRMLTKSDPRCWGKVLSLHWANPAFNSRQHGQFRLDGKKNISRRNLHPLGSDARIVGKLQKRAVGSA